MGSAAVSLGIAAEGKRKAARAAQGAAVAEATESRRQFDLARSDRLAREQRAISLAESPQEIAALEQALQRQEQSLDKQSRLFDALDPAVMTASKQALQLLQGQEAKSLGPLKRNREMQRTKLLNRLREQLGPGAETSTAGIQALNQFDMQTDEVLSGAQQQSLSQLFGMGSQGASQRGALNAGIGQLGQIGQAFGGAAGRRANAFLGASGQGAEMAAGQAMIGSAGAHHVGSQLRGQAQAGMGRAVFDATTQLGTAAFTRGFDKNKSKLTKDQA